jgi:hypothetical protein
VTGKRHRDPMEQALRAMPGTLNEMVTRIGAPKTTVSHWVQKLRACGWAHVGKWERSSGPGSIQPVFHAGKGRDAPKPSALTHTEITRRYIAKMRVTGEYKHWRAGVSAKQRLDRKLTRMKQQGRTPTPFDALLM